MIGQFVARFAGGIRAWQLLPALVIVPSIPIAIWFSVLYYYYSTGLEIGQGWRIAMVVVGVIFVINSLDSLIRLYTQNLDLTPVRFGRPVYIIFLDCCGMGDRAFIDAATGEVLRYSLGDY